MARATTSIAFRNAGAAVDFDNAAVAPRTESVGNVPPNLNLCIYGDLGAVESEWRGFERFADCAAFQTYDWLATWHRHVGQRNGVRLAIVVGRFDDGQTACILPLGVEVDRSARRLCWLGDDYATTMRRCLRASSPCA